MEHSAHENVASTFHSHPCPLKTLFLGVSHHLKYSGFSTGFHAGKQPFHLFQRQGMVFESPIARFAVLALLENLFGIADSKVVVCQHDNQFR